MSIDIEFTLALNNRTGKYFFCQDLIESTPDRINSVLYWRLPLKRIPTGLFARFLGRLALYEIEFRRTFRRAHRWLPLIYRTRPIVFMDPREVIFHNLKTTDCVICHDVGPITHPNLYHHAVKETYEMAYAKIKLARPHMLFVTQTSLKAFVSLYGKDFPTMDVISPPLRSAITEGPRDSVVDVRQPFLLTVGSLGDRKNQAGAIEAFRATGLSGSGYTYVLCGGPEPGFEAVAALADRTPGVKRLGYVSDSQLRWLYHNAIGFVLPSFLEGFGLPAAEAIGFGLVPLVSRGGALHEVTGDDAVLVDPANIDSIAEGMRVLVSLTVQERERRMASLISSALFVPGNELRIWNSILDKMEQTWG